MDLIEHTLQVNWRHRVLFTDHIFDPANTALRDVLTADGVGNQARALVVVDASVAAAQPALAADIASYFTTCADRIVLTRAPLVLEGGERVKNSDVNVARLHAEINRDHIDRHSYVIAVGGGALLDMAGLAAATAHRGVRHVRVPTTTLSQCDSGVGVKNGINAFGKKNFIGTFCPPFAVINDFQLLASLRPRDKRAGYAEAVKVACVRDAEFFEAIERDAAALREFELAPLRRVIRRCAELHLDHIANSGDPFESGSARPLDFGHWAAHKLEQFSDFEVCHGEAVAIGIAADVVYSRRMGYLSPPSAERILRLLEVLGFELFTPELLRTGLRGEVSLLEGLEEFREHLGGRLAITLLRSIGSGFDAPEMNSARVIESVQELQARHAARQREGVPAQP